MAAARTRKTDGSGVFASNDPQAFEAEIFDRFVASASGLPRVCVLKRCRRRKRCLGPAAAGELPCLRHHQGLARARFRSALKALGWDKKQ